MVWRRAIAVLYVECGAMGKLHRSRRIWMTLHGPHEHKSNSAMDEECAHCTPSKQILTHVVLSCASSNINLLRVRSWWSQRIGCDSGSTEATQWFKYVYRLFSTTNTCDEKLIPNFSAVDVYCGWVFARFSGIFAHFAELFRPNAHFSIGCSSNRLM